MSWINLADVSVAANSAVININNGQATSSIKKGDALVLAGSDKIHEIIGVNPSSVTLRLPITTAANNIAATIIPVAAEFREATVELRNATEILRNNFQAMDDWSTKMGTVTLAGFDGTQYTVRTAQQMDADAPVGP